MSMTFSGRPGPECNEMLTRLHYKAYTATPEAQLMSRANTTRIGRRAKHHETSAS